MTENQKTHVLRPEVKDLDTALQQLKYCRLGWTIAKLLMFCFEKKGAGNIIFSFSKIMENHHADFKCGDPWGFWGTSDAAKKKEGEIKAPH